MPENGDGPEAYTVKLPSGAVFYVLTPTEQEYVQRRVKLYMTHNAFKNISDWQDLDRLVTFELFVHRWSLFLSRGMDYYADEINERVLAAQVESYGQECRMLKRSLGLDKPARDKSRGDDSTVAYLAKLRDRAKEFGVMRNRQFDKALEIFHQLHALVGFHDRCTLEERKENHATMEEIFDWIRDVALPEFDAIDAEFRRTQQRMWIREMG